MENSQPAEDGRKEQSLWKQVPDDVIALTKARLSTLVVFTALFGYFVATRSNGNFSWWVLIHMLIGTTLAAFGAAVFNQLMEVDSDSRMHRTADRPLPANRMPKAMAFVMGWLLCAFGLIHLGVKVNIMSASMAAATLLTYLFIYTPMKRVSSANTIVGAVSGALPPLIGWAAGDGSLWSAGAVFLFGLLFLWQLPHFAAINWMYREEYTRGGFVMWSNEDETGAKTGKIAVFFAVVTLFFGIGFPLLSSIMHPWGAIALGVPSAVMLYLAVRFLRSGERNDAKTLFLFTLLYLPIVMIGSFLAWR